MLARVGMVYSVLVPKAAPARQREDRTRVVKPAGPDGIPAGPGPPRGRARGLVGAPSGKWIQDNVVPLVLLAIAIIILWIGGRGDNAGVARRSVGLIIGLVALGIAVSGQGPNVGAFLARLITG